jgi:hypothetical protein
MLAGRTRKCQATIPHIRDKIAKTVTEISEGKESTSILGLTEYSEGEITLVHPIPDSLFKPLPLLNVPRKSESKGT